MQTLFTETEENILDLKRKFFTERIRGLYKHQSYSIETMNKLSIEIRYTKHVLDYVTDDMIHDEKFEKELIEIILTHLEQMKNEERLPNLHYNIIKDGLEKWGIHNKF